MNIRLAIITLFFAFFFGVTGANAQEYVIKNGSIEMPVEAEMGGMYEYRDFIEIYVFLNSTYAERGLEALKKGEKVTTAERNNRPYNPDKNGNFSIEVAKGGYAVFWCKQREYKAKEPILKYNLISEVEFVSNQEEKATDLGPIEVFGERTTSSPEPANTALEGPEGMVRTFMFKIPYKVTEDMRIIAQPILYDRSDISDAESDVIHAYGRAAYVDMEEYHLTQERRMDFDLRNDTLTKIIKTQGDTVFHNELERQVLALQQKYSNPDSVPDIKSYVRVENDTIYFYAIDRFKGFDPDTSHPYPYGVSISVDGYNSEIYTVDFKDNGERRDPLRFLNFSFKEFLPDRNLFEEKMDDQRVSHPGELKLNFQPGKAVLASNDTASAKALKTLEQQLRSAQNPENREELYQVKVNGVASPEGNLALNKSLAKARAEFAKERIKSYVPRHVPINNNDTRVAGWDVLADSLMRAGHKDVANAVYEIVKAYPLQNDNDAAGFAKQQREISKLPEYNTLIKTEFLPKLRTVTYNYTINKIGQLPTDTVIARYRKDPEKEFSRGEYWCLFDNLENNDELETAAKIALRKTRNIDNADSIYCQGYWPYAASVLACCYIRRDTVDLNLLRPFFDFTLYKDSVTGKETLLPKTMKFSHYDNKKIAGYMNYPDMAANQLIMTLNSNNYSSKDIAILEGLIADAAREEPAYEQLLAFSMCLRGKYNGTEEKYVRARELVANSSPHNFVVMALAMDNPATISDDDEWLRKAATKVDSLEQTLVTKYLKSVVNIRLATDSLLNDADTLLAECFTEDIKFLLMGSNDADLVVRSGSTHNVFVNATNIWSSRMTGLALGDEHPYTWFKRAIDETKNKNPRDRVIKKNLYECFSLDDRYITILNIYMRDNKSLKENKEILTVLRRIRNEYLEKN